MRMEIVPVHAEIEIEDIPANALASVGKNGRRVADERPFVKAIRGHIVTTAFYDVVLAWATVDPCNLTIYAHGDRGRRKEEIANRYRCRTWATSLNNHFAAHQWSMNAAHVVVICSEREHRRHK